MTGNGPDERRSPPGKGRASPIDDAPPPIARQGEAAKSRTIAAIVARGDGDDLDVYQRCAHCGRTTRASFERKLAGQDDVPLSVAELMRAAYALGDGDLTAGFYEVAKAIYAEGDDWGHISDQAKAKSSTGGETASDDR